MDSAVGEMSRAKHGNSYELYRDGETTPAMLATIRIVLAARRWRAILDDRLRPSGQSAARMEAMSAILKTPGTKPQVEIAKRLRIEGPTLTRMLDTLEKDGLVERLPDPNDRRTKQLRLTGKGERTLEEIFEIAAGLRARLFDGIDIGDLEKVNAILGEVLDRLDGGLRDPE